MDRKSSAFPSNNHTLAFHDHEIAPQHGTSTMKLSAVPENPLEWLARAAGAVPTPILDTLIALLLARSVMVATRLDIFEALAGGPLLPDEVAARCGTDPSATAKLLSALAGADYLTYDAGRYGLAPVARKWLLKDSPHSLRDAILLQLLDARFIEHLDDFVRSGEPVHMHEGLTTDEWALYMRGMRSGATLAASELVRRVPVPSGARAMLDIGGAHGYYSVALCRRHLDLRSTILDLPEACAAAAPLLAAEGMGDRVVYQPGNALTTDLGVETYDLVLIANLAHHFSAGANRALVRRIARALRPGGALVFAEVMRPRTPGDAGQAGALADLYFALTSESGAWSFEEMAAWQREAGLIPRKPMRLLTAPGGGLQIATRPRVRSTRFTTDPMAHPSAHRDRDTHLASSLTPT
jgi:SAM-dependent methyltransferase